MTKDRLNFRPSLKHAYGTVAMEDAIGVTQLLSSEARSGDMDRLQRERSLRAVGLMKWSFDDFIVRERLLLDGLINTQSSVCSDEVHSKASYNTFLLPVISEGVPDSELAALIERKCPRTSVRFLTPLEFGSSHERFALVKCASSSPMQRCFQVDQMMHTASGAVRFGKVTDVSWLKGSSFPLTLLPDLQYSVVLRGVKGSLSDVLPRLESLKSKGFLNYTHMARHGTSVFRAFESGRHLLHRDYPAFLRSYVSHLTESSPLLRKELPSLLELLGNSKSGRSDWMNVQSALEYSLKKDEPIVRRPQTGLYYPHHELLQDFIQRASKLVPKNHDSAQVIRETVARLVIQEKLRSIADVHFNALASMRWETYGDAVVVGDLVVPSDDKGPLDVFEAPADHLNGAITLTQHPEWLSDHSEAHLNTLLERVRLVQSPEEAKRYTIRDVVLPVLGPGVERLLLPSGRLREASERLSLELHVEALPRMTAAPPATYRRLVACPMDFSYCVFDDSRGWCWESDPAAPIRPELYVDQEGITRQPSPLFVATGKNIIARRGIRGTEQRSYFLKPARRDGMTCIMRMTLPRGTAFTSALREVFQFVTLDPAAIFRLLR